LVTLGYFDNIKINKFFFSVTAALQEPHCGWVDNTSGITGIVMEVSRGTIRSVYCDKKLTVDIIPVDFVVNTLLVAAANLYWHNR